MKIISRITGLIFLLSILTATLTSQTKNDTTMTRWDIEPSFKYDALCFLNILTADTFYLTYYKDEYEKFKPKLTPEVIKALSNMKYTMKDENGTIISAFLCLYFSAVEDSTLEQMSARLDNLQIMDDYMKKTPYYNEDSWKLLVSQKNNLKVIFNFLKDIDFTKYWQENILPKVQTKILEIEPKLPQYDIVKEDEEMLGFKLPSDKITVYMLYYSQPHGIRVTGMRFLTDIAWPFNIVIRNAAHEMMHPPYDILHDNELKDAIESMGNDTFLMDKVLHHNPSFGYNTLEGLMEEDCVQTLEQIVNEKLGIAKDAKKRWEESDDGIHVFAIALYQVMKEKNYNVKEEKFRDFLVRNIKDGTLAPGKIMGYYNRFYKQ